MLFSDPLFLFGFLPASVLVWCLARPIANREAVVLTVMIGISLLYYSWTEVSYLAILRASITLNWLAGRIISGSGHSCGKAISALAIAGNLCLIGVFKYALFLSGRSLNLAMPLGISFFTFQQISYIQDTYRSRDGELKPLRYAFVIAFFPHLVSGPIVRYREIRTQFDAFLRCRPTRWNLTIGTMLIVTGLAKKILVADSLAPVVDTFYTQPPAAYHAVASLTSLLAAVAFYLQIYFDFSGYTDIAIGIARLFNIRFPNNFDFPYRACSLSDFWRRWHITLSRFLRDYLYIPLGGNRVPAWRMHANLLITMLLGGLWHGAAWNFVVWGGLHGLGLIAFHLWRRARIVAATPRILRWGATQLFVLLAWIVFRAPSLDTAWAVLASLTRLDLTGDDLAIRMIAAFYERSAWRSVLPLSQPTAGVVMFLFAGMLMATLRPPLGQLLRLRSRPALASGMVTVMSCLIALSLYLKAKEGAQIDPFIYFQF
jgi:D-alanyl-lipoteichoic acid acyltransferase DltB (MBOAT superfamily)